MTPNYLPAYNSYLLTYLVPICVYLPVCLANFLLGCLQQLIRTDYYTQDLDGEKRDPILDEIVNHFDGHNRVRSSV